MIPFKKPQLSDRKWVQACVQVGHTNGTSYSFGSIFTWGEAYKVEIAEYGGMLLARGCDENGRYYVYPSGDGDVRAALEAMMQDAVDNGSLFCLTQILPENKEELEALYPGKFQFTYDRDSCEYVYRVSDMADLPGKKYHAKKNHLNAFFRNHTDISCDPITEDNLAICMEIENRWLAEKTDEDGSLLMEHRAIELALKHFNELGFSGAILYADGQPVAFTIGESLKNNMFCTHFEKTVPEYKDAFPVINNGFTKLMLMSYDYVDREEDTGAPGLRKAKLSYHPAFFLDKYTAVLKTDPLRKYTVTPSDIPELKSLWKTVFGDGDDVIDPFFDGVAQFSDTYAYRVDGKIVSAFYLIDASLQVNRETRPAKYLFAAATLPEYRGNGYMKKLIRYAADVQKKAGIADIFLFPANESLYNFYESLGFVCTFRERECQIRQCDLTAYRGKRYFYTTLSYVDLRQSIPAAAYADFAESYLDFSAYCAEKYGFRREVIFDDEDRVIILGNPDDDMSLTVDEAISSDGNYEHILAVLADSGYESIRLYTPVEIETLPFPCVVKDFGMQLPLRDYDGDTYLYLGQPCR